MIIEVYADVACPFTHVGLRMLVARRAQLARPELAIRVRAWPLELVNGRPLDPNVVAQEIEALAHETDPALFAGFDPARFPSTSLPALDLAERAYRSGDDVGEEVSLALRHELFVAGRDIADPAVLGAVASRFGLERPVERERDAVLEDWRGGARRGVRGSPHFFCGAENVFCPSLEIAKSDDRLSIRVDRGALDAFLAACLPG